MPNYDFKCRECGEIRENVLLRITHDECDRPFCCGNVMQQHFTVPPQVHWVDPVIEPFRAIATKDRPVITTQRQNREYMARNGLVDANDFGPPPTQKEQMAEAGKMQESIDAISPTAEQAARLQEAGLDSVVD